MGRRRRHSDEPGLIDALIDIAKLSPLVGLVISVVLFVGAAYLTWGNPKLAMGLAPLFGLILAMLGLLCFAASAVSSVKKLAMLMAKPAPSRRLCQIWTIDAVRDMSWQDFEQLVAQVFQRMGYFVDERGRAAQVSGTGDGGVDLILTSAKAPGARFLVQCKQYRAWDVGEPKVREFYGAMAAWQTRCEGIIVTCGRFSQPARAFAVGKPMRLIDGDGLLQLLNQTNPISPEVHVAVPPPIRAAAVEPPPLPSTAGGTAPVCPSCGARMLRKVAGRGPRKGQPFWGCSNYPRCTVCINIDE